MRHTKRPYRSSRPSFGAKCEGLHEPKNVDYKAVAENAEKDICCGHDKFFWKKFRTCAFGDVIHCGRCHQYFGIIKVLPWATVRKYDSWDAQGNNHLSDRFAVLVKARVN